MQSKICDIMVNTTIGTPVDRLAAVNALLLKQEDAKCLDYKYDAMINDMTNTSWKSDMASGSKNIFIRLKLFKWNLKKKEKLKY